MALSTAWMKILTWRAYQKNGVLAYLLNMKETEWCGIWAVVPYAGAGCPGGWIQGMIDQLMFSINAAYDYQHGDYANGSAGERHGAVPPLRG